MIQIKKFTHLILLCVLFFTNGCLCFNKQQPGMKTENNFNISAYDLGVIGEVENVYFDQFSRPFEARIDTGAKTSSINAQNIKELERDGQKWVRFDVFNPESKEKHTFSCKVQRITFVKRQDQNDKRFVIKLRFRIGKLYMSREFTLADRAKLQYPILIGRNVLAGKAIVDVSRKKTLN